MQTDQTISVNDQSKKKKKIINFKLTTVLFIYELLKKNVWKYNKILVKPKKQLRTLTSLAF